MSEYTRWASRFYTEHLGDNQAAVAKRVEWCRENGVAPKDDLTCVQLQLELERTRSHVLSLHADLIADKRRTDAHKALGKQYGLASRTIHQLHGEIALLKQRPTHKAVARAQAFGRRWRDHYDEQVKFANTIRNDESVARLPVGAVVRDNEEWILEQRDEGRWFSTAESMCRTPVVPVVVLWRPKEDS